MNKMLGCSAVVLLGCSGSPTPFGDDTSMTDSGGPDGTAPTSDAGMAPGMDAPPPPPSSALAANITLTDITFLQGVEVKVVKAGALATKNAAVVGGRPGLARAFFTLGSGWSSHKLTGVLTLHTAGVDHVFTASLAPSASSTDSDFQSTFDFSFDAASVGADTTFMVQLLDPSVSTGTNTQAQFPTSGTPTSLGVTSTGNLHIHLFPIHFTSYSASTPATGSSDISAYASVVMGLYPATGVTITVEPSYDYSGPVPQADGTYWDELLNTMIQERGNDATTDDYYYGAFAPTSTFDSYCGGGCVAGLSSIPNSSSDIGQKASIGLVYGGSSDNQLASGQTMAHEVGHGHGRSHSPTTDGIMGCSTPSGIDPSYPYTDGEIGVYGWDINASASVDPSNSFDVMGYCQTVWISDYTYDALAQWMAADNGADIIMPKSPTRVRQIRVAKDGSLTVGKLYTTWGILSGTKRQVTYQATGTSHTATGFYYPYDHVAGGYILAPE